jgi:hypothetical protein
MFKHFMRMLLELQYILCCIFRGLICTASFLILFIDTWHFCYLAICKYLSRIDSNFIKAHKLLKDTIVVFLKAVYQQVILSVCVIYKVTPSPFLHWGSFYSCDLRKSPEDYFSIICRGK